MSDKHKKEEIYSFSPVINTRSKLIAEEKINPGRSLSPSQLHNKHFDFMYERAKSKDAKLHQLSATTFAMYNYRPVTNTNNNINSNFSDRQENFIKRKIEKQEK